MSEKFIGNHPFRENLENLPDSGSTLIKEIKNNPEKIIRKEIRSSDARGFRKPISLEEFNFYKDVKRHFDELNNKYGISVVPFDFVLGEDDEKNKTVMYVITDKIYGENLLTVLREKNYHRKK